jgi:Mn2+/Fe2+ NRAMP family transporter
VYARYLKWLALVTLSYVFAAIFAKVPWKELLMQTLRPTLSWTRESLMLITGVLGTTISPYLFFWQTAQEVEEEETHKHTALIPKKEVRAMRMDVWSGMFLSNFVMFAIIATAGYALHAHGITNITTADQAAQALRPFAGDFAYILFALGIIGTGMLAIPVLAGSLSYALAETFGWKQGLNKKLHQARAFYGSLILAVVLGLVMNFFHIDPIAALIGSAVLNGLIAPIMLVFVLGIASRKSIMGPLANTKFANAIGWLLTLLMSGAAVGTIISIL